ncbi:saccharopine dehydrogenase NADP-binding domain-containing protein [Sphingopyxis granuli]|uniref:saccharopine dehydrogenase NADP-binding domain-containing protein n=1 Tax=Sphingopyxis granuli TaxID=267128 RepID=UPI001F53B0EA|nr:saccharopine dehydrogenase NADP-binding domain-containing protein [Sphingopyxis granuli]UNK79595.1 saccharopine dehydrogenase NADP-binding domain-containing protein [Sphingopyxis granuli]
MENQKNGRQSLLIVGGYGVVGLQIAELLSERNPELELIIAGRSEASASQAAKRFPNARALRVDVDQADPLMALSSIPDAVLAVANDSHDRLLDATTKRGAAFIDITRWTERMHASILRLAPTRLTAPVVLSSGWMAGVVATVAAADADKFGRVDSINIDILYAIKDKAGPNSLEYADRLAIPFPVQIDGQTQMKKALSDPREVTFSGGRSFQTYRFDTPDQYTLVQSTCASSVSTRLAYDDSSAVNSLRFMLNTGIWKILSLSMFDGVRKSMLYNPGQGDVHEVIVETTGIDTQGGRTQARSSIIDALGQTHMTAAGAAAQVERVLALKGRTIVPPGISFPDQTPDIARALESLREMGVSITRAS